MAKKRRPVAVINYRTIRKISEFIVYMRSLVLNIGNASTIFTAPNPALPAVTTNTTDLEDAEATARTRVVGSAAARDVAFEKSNDDLTGLLGYVQRLADLAADEPTAISIIQAAGFGVRRNGVRVKPLLAVKNTEVEGEIKLTAKAAGKRASYEWQQSPDGSTWTTFDITLQAKTILDGLTSGDKWFFRVRAILITGEQSWTSAVGIVIL
jgi:hypothetical protein